MKYLLAELEEMEADVAQAHTQADAENVLILPSAPTKMPKAAAAEDEDDEIMHELRLLEQSMLVSN